MGCSRTCKKKFWKIRIFNRETKRFWDRVSWKKKFFPNRYFEFSNVIKRPFWPLKHSQLLKENETGCLFAFKKAKNDCLIHSFIDIVLFYNELNGDFDNSFGRKFALFNWHLNDPLHSCDHFHTKLLVVGGHLRRRKGKKQLKMAINYNMFLTTSYEQALQVIPHLKALNLKFVIRVQLSAVITWWRSRAKWTKTLKWL